MSARQDAAIGATAVSTETENSPAAGQPVSTRIVFHFGGYDPVPPPSTYGRFVRELRRFGAAWPSKSNVSDLDVSRDFGRWSIATAGPNWNVVTDHHLFRWDDIMATYANRPVWWRIPMALVTFADFIVGGALFGYARTNWRYALFFIYPFLLLGLAVAVSWYLGAALAHISGSSFLGLVAGLGILTACWLWPLQWAHLPLAFDDWIFSRDYIRHPPEELERKLDSVAGLLLESARERDVDEIVLLGHSLGAVLAVDALARALGRDPKLGTTGPKIALVTVGSSLLKIGLHRSARRLWRALEPVAVANGIFWVDYQALTDVMNFYKCDPMKECGLTPTGKPVIRTVRISHMLEPATYRRVKRNLYRVHCQFISGNDRRAAYDYFMQVCGPVTAEQQALPIDGAMSLFTPDGRLNLPVANAA